MNIYSIGKFDIIPDHIWWSVEGVDYAPIQPSLSQFAYKFNYNIDKNISFGNPRQEVDRAVAKLYADTNKTLAICLSGRDSEVIARSAAQQSIPYKLYFLRFWGMEESQVTNVKTVAKELNQDLTLVELTREYCLDELIQKSFEVMVQYAASYLCMPAIFEQIPEDELIVVGNGDIAQGDFTGLPYKSPLLGFLHPSDRGIPILTSEIAYRLWAQKNRRHGQFYFWSSTPELLLSMYNDPDIDIQMPVIRTNKVFTRYWPELTFKEKSFTWTNQIENHTEIRTRLWQLNKHRHSVFATPALIPELSLKI